MARTLGSVADGLTFPVLPQLDNAAVKRITAKVDELTRSRDVNVKINGARLDADLKKYQLEMARLSGDKTVVFKAKANLVSAKLASAELSAVAKDAGEKSGNSFSRGFSGKISSLGRAIGFKGSGLFAAIGLGIAAAQQAAPALVSAIGAVGASFAGTGIAVGVFGAMVKTVLSGASADATSLATLQTKLSDATTKKQRANIQKQINDLEKGWSAGHRSVVTSIAGIETQWKKLSDRIATPVLAPFLDAVSKGMKHLAPLVQPVANVFRSWGKDMDRYFSSSRGSAELNRIATALGKFAGGQLKDIGKFIGDVAKGVFNLARDMKGVNFGAFGQDLAKWGTAFLSWSSSAKARADVGKFLSWLHGNSGTLVSAVKSLASNLPAIMKGLAQGGGLELKGITSLLTALGKLPPGVVSRLVTAVPLMFALSKGVLLVGAAVRLWTGAQAALDFVLDANPVGVIILAIAALAGAFYLAWTHSATFRNIVISVFKAVGDGAITFAEIFLNVMKGVADTFLNVVGAIVHGAAAAFGWVPGVGGKLKGAAKAFDGFRGSVDGSFDKLHGTLEKWKKQLDEATGKAAADRVKKASAAISGDFTSQGKAATTAKGALASYTAAIKANGLNSTAARKARTTLVNDMIAAGVNSKIANRDVDNYTSAIKHHSANSDAVRSARLRLINDIISAGRNAGQGKKDLDLFTSAVEHHSSSSDQVRGARARLIQDLKNTGLDSKTATGLVNGLQGSINALHGKTVPVMVDVGAAGTITATAAGALSKAAGLSGTSVSNLAAQLVFGMGHAAGGLIGGSGNRDTVPALLTPGEVVVPRGMVARGAVDHLRGKLPGFANGGRVPGATALLKDESLAGAIDAHWSAGIGVEFGTMIRAAFASKIAAAAKAAAKAAAAAAGSPVAYSRIAGVTQWEPDVLKVLAMLGLPSSDLPTVMSQMLTESGGNPNSINLSDSNARAGTPSKGLMQVIAGTFAAYRNPSLSGNIYDPLANIYAGINYAIHRYGNPGWLSVLGHGHGYAAGGLVGKVFDSGGTLDPGANLVYNMTGKPERVTPAGNGDVTVTLELGPNFKRHTGLTDQELADIRYTVRTRGGGSAERAFGRNN